MTMGIAELIRSGVTCFNDMYFGIPTQVAAGKAAGIRGVYGINVFSGKSREAENCDDALKNVYFKI